MNFLLENPRRVRQEGSKVASGHRHNVGYHSFHESKLVLEVDTRGSPRHLLDGGAALLSVGGLLQPRIPFLINLLLLPALGPGGYNDLVIVLLPLLLLRSAGLTEVLVIIVLPVVDPTTLPLLLQLLVPPLHVAPPVGGLQHVSQALQAELLLVEEGVAQVDLDWDLGVLQLVGEAVLHHLGRVAAGLHSVPAALLVPHIPLRFLRPVVTHLVGNLSPEPLRTLQSPLQVQQVLLELGLDGSGRRAVTFVQPFLKHKLRGGGQC